VLSPVEEIKNRLDILEVIQGYLKLQKAGSNWKATCPFHSEKTPSFMVSPSRQIWHCFGCQEGGDIFSFVSKIEGIEFADALRLLAEKAGIKLSRQDPQIQSQRQKLYEICALATRFFERQLLSQSGQAAVNYLRERGVNKKTIDYFRIGWAPDNWQTLSTFLKSQRYQDADIAASGLSVESEKRNDYHDRFRSRIMFPIADTQEQVIGFSGRLFDQIKPKTVGSDAGKYINTPNTLIYDKSRALFGLDKAKTAIRQLDSCVLVEGNLDVVLSHQVGVKQAVAACGTALGEDHLKIIKRYSNKILLAFDADDAGQTALRKSVTSALAYGLNVLVVDMPLGKDTADVVKEKPELWQEAVNKPAPYIQHLLLKSLNKFPELSIKAKKAVSDSVLPIIKSLASPIERDYWLGELALKIKVEKEVLRAELNLSQVENKAVFASADGSVAARESEMNPPEALTVMSRLNREDYILALLIKYPNFKKHLDAETLELFSWPADLKTVLTETSDNINLENFQVNSAVAVASEWAGEIIDAENEFLKVVAYFKRQYFQEKLKMIQADIKIAEAAGDQISLEVLLAEFNQMSKRLIS